MAEEEEMRNVTHTRRKFPRVEVEIRLVEITTEDEGIFSGVTKNLSVGGICVLIERELESGVLTILRIILPDDKPPIECNAQVSWSELYLRVPKKLYACGMKFLDLEEEDEQRLADFLERSPDAEKAAEE